MRHSKLLELLKFVENYTLEDKLWFRLQSLFSANKAEVTYRNSTRKWDVSFPGIDITIAVSTEELPEFLSVRHVDLADFEASLTFTILELTAYASMIIGKSEELFGREMVRLALEGQIKFRDDLVSAIEAVLKPSITLVKE